MTHQIAVAGVGGAARTHARAYANLDDAEIVACSGLEAENVRAFAADYDCAEFLDVAEMLDEADPDVLSVCTPSGAHLAPTLAAAERGVDVLSEKPLEVTTERIDRMIAAAEDGGIRLGGIFQRRYKPIVRTVREAVAAGRFGRLTVANAALPWWRDDGYYDSWQGTWDLGGGGAIMTQSIHSIDAIQWIAGAGMDLDPDENPVAEVFAFTDLLGRDDPEVTDVEDTAVATLRYRDGTLGQVLGATSMYPGGRIRYELAGPDGTARVSGEELDAWQFRDERENDEQVRERFSGPDAGSDEPSPLETPNVREFLDARESGEPFMLDGPEARKSVEIVEAIYESAETGESVSLE